MAGASPSHVPPSHDVKRQSVRRFLASYRPSVFLLLTGLLVVAAGLLDLVRPVDNLLEAARMRVIQRDASQTLALVEIDSASIAAEGVWPWPRERFADALKKLEQAGAGFIGFDVDFSAASTPGGDAAFASAIDARPGLTILPTFVQRDGLVENRPAPMFARSSVLSSVSIPTDADGVIRHYKRGYNRSDVYRPSVAGVLANTAEGDTSSFLIDFGIRAETIPHIRFMDLLKGNFDPKLVNGRSILIGATAVELSDDYPVSTHPSMPGAVIHAVAYENLLQNRALISSGLCVDLCAALAMLLLLWPRSRAVNVRLLLARNAAIAAGLVALSCAMQAAYPVSLDLGLVFLTQGLALIATVYRELERRRLEILRQKELRLTFLARHDPETGLPNRRALLDAWVDQPFPESGWVLTIGVERAEILRGAIGYANANAVMTELAGRLAERWGKDAVFQLSNSVFCIAKREGAPPADPFRHDGAILDTRFSIEGQNVELALRWGLSSAGTSLADLLEKSALCLDYARLKALPGKAHADLDGFDPRQQLAILSGVKRAIAENEFRLEYQPKVDARGAVIGAEALIRWRHPEQGELSPAKFIELAEELGSIGLITRWTVRQAVRDWVQLSQQGVEIPLSINLSGKLLADEALVIWMINAIQDAGADIKMEITETALLGDGDVQSSIDRIRQAGIEVSIDDYGAGLSTLSYLKRIRADELKLDRSLILDIDEPRDQMIVGSTIRLAHMLGMVVIAEGIEDAKTQQILVQLGCDGFQGYFFARPAPLHKLIDFYANAIDQRGAA